MPELPEVETIKRGLEKRIVGKTISDVDIRSHKIFQGQSKDVIGKKVIGLKRRAKILCICLEEDINLLFHLKMTGQLIYRSVLLRQDSAGQQIDREDRFAGGHPSNDWVAELPNEFTRILFTFDDSSKLFFNDMRMFGWCKVLTNKEVEDIFHEDYGPEPFDSTPTDRGFTRDKPHSEKFTVEYLMRMAARYPNRKVKQFITDQKIIAGVGNIYADESLFDAKISPLRPVKDINMKEWEKLRKSVIKSLELGIKWGGASVDTYVNAEGKVGDAHLHTKVYRHTGAPCPDGCGGTVKKITLGGRGTHYCPNCQK